MIYKNVLDYSVLVMEVLRKKKDFIINTCLVYVNDVNFDSLNHVFSHVMLSNVLYMTNVLKRNGIFYAFTFEECHGHDVKTSIDMSAFVLYIVYEYDHVVVKLAIPINYLLMFCTHFSPLCPVVNKECPICLEKFDRCFQCSRCGRCTCETCYGRKLEHNTKCPLCNFEVNESSDIPVNDSFAFLRDHPVDYEQLFSRVCFNSFGNKMIVYTLVGKKAFDIKDLINAYDQITA